jgi:hypothetical protein
VPQGFTELSNSQKSVIAQDIINKERAPQARDIAASIVGVSPRYVQYAKQVAEADKKNKEQGKPELLPDIKAGNLTIKAAIREINRSEKLEQLKTPVDIDSIQSEFNIILADPPWRYEMLNGEPRPCTDDRLIEDNGAVGHAHPCDFSRG